MKKDSNVFEDWTNIVKEIDYDSKVPLTDVTVPTGETVSYEFFIKKLVTMNYPTLLIGLAGCGKTQLIKGILNDLSASNTKINVMLNFN